MLPLSESIAQASASVQDRRDAIRALIDRGDYSAAEPDARKLEKEILSRYGKDSESYSIILADLAEICLETNRLDEAAAHLKQVVVIREKLFGPTSETRAQRQGRWPADGQRGRSTQSQCGLGGAVSLQHDRRRQAGSRSAVRTSEIFLLCRGPSPSGDSLGR